MYRITRVGDTSGESLAKAFCNIGDVRRTALRVLKDERVRLSDLRRLGKALSLSPSHIHDRERKIFEAQFLRHSSSRYSSWKLIGELADRRDLQDFQTLEIAIGSAREDDGSARQFRIIVTYEYFSLIVGTIFKEAITLVEKGMKLSDVRISERKFRINNGTIAQRILDGDPEKLALAMQLARRIAKEIRNLLLPWLDQLVNEEYVQTLSSFVKEVQEAFSSVQSNRKKIAQLMQTIIHRHQSLKGSWSWINKDPLTGELIPGCLQEEWFPLHSYRIASLGQIVDELQGGH